VIIDQSWNERSPWLVTLVLSSTQHSIPRMWGITAKAMRVFKRKGQLITVYKSTSWYLFKMNIWFPTVPQSPNVHRPPLSRSTSNAQSQLPHQLLLQSHDRTPRPTSQTTKPQQHSPNSDPSNDSSVSESKARNKAHDVRMGRVPLLLQLRSYMQQNLRMRRQQLQKQSARNAELWAEG